MNKQDQNEEPGATLVTLLPNPALDKTVVLSGFTPGRIYRPREVITLAGGKGFNFARALHTLGQRSVVVCPIGGHAGQHLLELAARDELLCDGIPTPAELRTCLTIIDPDQAITEIYEPGEPLPADVWEALVERAASYFPRVSFLTLSGSFPPGTPAHGLRNLVSRAKAAGISVLLDTYGPQLLEVLELGPHLLKVNQVEAGETVDRTINTPEQALAAAHEIQRRGVREVVITLGKQGVVGLPASGEAFGWLAPEVEAISPTGSGDSLFAGLASGLVSGQSLSNAARLGVAAGAANTVQLGAGRLDRQLVEELVRRVQPLALKA
ncbi:hypothetical protein EPA93_33170 [Ktedonosporobacter rubrisoli]|uniref:Carbohydrate kinase PfkB domain-containing protein n=1 Tax=Ktedonosporobacter rubrisoli TaxID=2509675 RepID=A0A4P6JYL2_KTERU|nr:hexose kinase [Ktedonosporobacter rubrisoli]QBD80563.1 hypothetical protein EPA93_33170 [Ktedonosporobacter rubrisoli]